MNPKIVHYTRGLKPKRVTSGGAHIRGLAPGQYSSQDTQKQRQAAGDIVSDRLADRTQTGRAQTMSFITTPAVTAKRHKRSNLTLWIEQQKRLIFV